MPTLVWKEERIGGAPTNPWNGSFVCDLGDYGKLQVWNNCHWEPGEWSAIWEPSEGRDDPNAGWYGRGFESAEKAQQAVVEGVKLFCRGVLERLT